MSKPRVVIVETEPAYSSRDEWAQHLLPTRTLDRALVLRGRILDTYEVTGDPTRRPFRSRDLPTMATAEEESGSSCPPAPSDRLRAPPPDTGNPSSHDN